MNEIFVERPRRGLFEAVMVSVRIKLIQGEAILYRIINKGRLLGR